MRNDILNRHVVDSVTAAGKPVTCASVAIELGEKAQRVRESLHCLIDDGLIVERNGLYERVGGFDPMGGAA